MKLVHLGKQLRKLERAYNNFKTSREKVIELENKIKPKRRRNTHTHTQHTHTKALRYIE